MADDEVAEFQRAAVPSAVDAHKKPAVADDGSGDSPSEAVAVTR